MKVMSRHPFLLLTALILALGVAAISTGVSGAARTISLHESGNLRLVSHQGTQILNEAGSQTGTFKGTMHVQISLSYTTATIKFSVLPGHGSFSGQGVVSYYVAGNVAHFTGALKIIKGTGSYTHISATHLQIVGAMQRKTYASTAVITGSIIL